MTGEQMEPAYVDQGYIGDASEQAAAHGMRLDVVQLSEAAASPAITSGCRKRWPRCTFSPLLASCCISCSTSSHVHNTH